MTEALQKDDISHIFSEFQQKRSQIEIPLSQIKRELAPFQDQIVLYGAGSAGIAFLEYLRKVGIEPRFFADGDPKKWRKTCRRLEILSPQDIVPEVGQKALVIVCINTDGVRYCKSFAEMLRDGGHGGVHLRLHQAGCNNVVDYTYFRRCFCLFHDDPYNLPSCSDVNSMQHSQESLRNIYDCLADDLSQETFRKIVAFRLLDDGIQIPTLPQDHQYFETSIYQEINDEVFIDCGAFNGITLKTFLNHKKYNFNQYYAIEPDKTNYIRLFEYVSNLSPKLRQKIQVHPWAAYDQVGTQQLYSLQGPGSFLSNLGTLKVPTNTIDHMLDGRRASFIKMNIEGSELQALQGAEYTIRTYRPVLAIAGYHKTWDLWEVPLKILEYNPKYRLYLRSYMNHISFVYYALPDERVIK